MKSSLNGCSIYSELNADTPSLHYHYNSFITTTGISAPTQHIAISTSHFYCLCLFTCHCCAGSCVSQQSLVYTHASLMPFAKQSNSGLFLLSSLFSGDKQVLAKLTLSTLLQRFTCVHLCIPHMTDFFFFSLFPLRLLP